MISYNEILLASSLRDDKLETIICYSKQILMQLKNSLYGSLENIN